MAATIRSNTGAHSSIHYWAGGRTTPDFSCSPSGEQSSLQSTCSRYGTKTRGSPRYVKVRRSAPAIMARCRNGGGVMASQVELTSFSVGPMDNNVYILIDADTRDSILFDTPVDSDRILAALEGTNLQYILFTHA